MDISSYFEPMDMAVVDYHSEQFHPMLGDDISAYTPEAGFPSLDGVKLALVGVPEDRASVYNRGCAAAPDQIRRYLYRLAKPHAETSSAVPPPATHTSR